MSHPKPPEIWDAVFPTPDNSDIITRPVLILTAPSVQKTCLVTPLLASKPIDAESITIEQNGFQNTKPCSPCFINPHNLYPIDITLFITKVSSLTPSEFDKLKDVINSLIRIS